MVVCCLFHKHWKYSTTVPLVSMTIERFLWFIKLFLLHFFKLYIYWYVRWGSHCIILLGMTGAMLSLYADFFFIWMLSTDLCSKWWKKNLSPDLQSLISSTVLRILKSAVPSYSVQANISQKAVPVSCQSGPQYTVYKYVLWVQSLYPSTSGPVPELVLFGCIDPFSWFATFR